MSLTEQQIKDLKPGDVVTVRLTVADAVSNVADSAVMRNSKNMVHYVPYADIISVEPRPIQVGDKVKLVFSPNVYEVVLIEGDEAVLWREDSGLHIADLEDLVRVDG